VILMGWPMEEESNVSSSKLVKLREKLNRQNKVRHKYNNDNDFYLVIGQFENLEGLKDSELLELREEAERLEKIVRNYLASNPMKIGIITNDLFFVQYQKETLDISTSKSWSFKAAENNPDLIGKLYTSKVRN